MSAADAAKMRNMRERLAQTMQRAPFRVAVAVALLAFHLLTFRSMAARWNLPFNLAPHEAPTFVDPRTDTVPLHWNRLVVSRWDSQHYIDLTLRGLSQCPAEGLPKKGPTLPFLYTCQLNFWPGYPLLGWIFSAGTRLPVDYALLGISLASSLLFLFLWTSPTMVRTLGVGGVYASLLAFNAHCNGFALVTIQTEPLLLLFMLSSFLAFANKRYVWAGFFAGCAGIARVSGPAVGLACGIAILVSLWRERPERKEVWRRLGAAALCGWAVLALFVYYGIRLKAPFAYLTAHAESYGHHPSLFSVLSPKTEWLKLSVNEALHPGLWVGATLLWFALGHRTALGNLDVPTQVFAYVLFFATLGVSVTGTIDLGLEGNSRYTLVVLPAFWAIGALLRRRPTALVVWLAMSFWFYRETDQCHYVGGLGQERYVKCLDR